MTLRDYLKLTPKQKVSGVFIQGDATSGEFKNWHLNGQLWYHCFYKDEKLNGEFKNWFSTGKLHQHLFYKDREIIKNYLEEK